MRPKSLLPVLTAATLAVSAAATTASASAMDCNTNTWYSMYQSKPFTEFGDNANYWIMIGGGFENAWYYSQWRWSGAKVVDGGEPFHLYKGDQALAMSDGASATTPTVCINPKNPSFRFAMKASTAGSTLSTTVNFTTPFGVRVSVPARTNVIEQGGSWVIADAQPLATLIPSYVLAFGTTASITFNASAPDGGQIKVDSVMVDPYRRG